ncbi:MAG: putative sulfate exporter family transporter, partial [Candidatus Rokubacteria bacterium]|nr:putative sulfate exporter family transporter [Candidatus Rokubacteria bacterium]
MMAGNRGVVTILKTEDWLAVWLGFLIIILVLFGVRPEMPKFRWATDAGFAAAVDEKKPAVGRLVKDAEAKGEKDVAAAATALSAAVDKGDRAAIGSAAKKVADAAKKAQDAGVKKLGADVGKLSGDAGALVSKAFSGENIWNSVKLGIAYLIISAIGIALMGGGVGKYIVGFPIVYALAWLSQVIAGNSTMSYWGLEYVIFALLIGLFISNVLGVPGWLREVVRTEYFIKTGLVILGAGILFGEIVQAGALGIVQALLVVSVVWYICFWFSRRLRVDDEFAVMLSTAVSICGVSAAIAACGAIKGDRKKLSYVTSLVLIVAVPMMVIMPWIVKAFGIPDVVGGAWLGGTLDTSASVVAAGALISEPAMKAGVIVKFSQNVLIG